MNRSKKNVDENQDRKWSRLNRVIGISLAYLLIVLFVMLPTTLSAYVSTTGGTDSARVARMELDTGITFAVMDMKPGDTKSFVFVMDGSVSEVTQAYTIAMDCTGNLPVTYTLSCVATGGTPIEGTMLPNTTYSGGVLPHGNSTHTYSLTLHWDESKTAYQYADEIEYVTVTTQSVQVD